MEDVEQAVRARLSAADVEVTIMERESDTVVTVETVVVATAAAQVVVVAEQAAAEEAVAAVAVGAVAVVVDETRLRRTVFCNDSR